MRRRVLVVDDDANTAHVLAFLLRSGGFEVDACAEPLSALAKLDTELYDILVTDHVMDGMTGLELARRSRDLHPSIRCFVVSGQSPPSLEGHAVTWIEKPVDASALLAALEGR
jgi:CheY-like chemotaxis protein